MHKKKFSVKRRAAMKKSLQGAIATGTITAASSWKKPIIDAVVLPAHANTSQPEPEPVISIVNLTVIGSDSGPNPNETLSVDNPANGANIGTLTGAWDSGDFALTGRVNPLPPAGTEVTLSVNETEGIADVTSPPCVLVPSGTHCPTTNTAVNNANGDFSFAAGIEGLDDGSNVHVVTLSVLGTPDTVVRFNVEV